MRFRHELTYEADADEVTRCSPTRCSARRSASCQQVLRYAVSVEETDDGLTRSTSTRCRPRAASRRRAQTFVGDEIKIEQRETWHSPTDAALEVTIPGKPVRMSGTHPAARSRDGRPSRR